MKLDATVITDIWPELLFFSLVAMGEWVSILFMSLRSSELSGLVAPVVTLIDRLTITKLGFGNQLLIVLGVVLGLVISFRTTTAYER